MAKSSNLNIWIDPDIKKQAECLFAQFGITITDAVTLAAMKEADETAQSGLGFDDVEDMLKELKS